jgi:fructosamine-3-kinase
VPNPPRYGFPVPTHCGATQLDNTWEKDWATFYRERRLGDMVRRLRDEEVDVAWEAMQGK